jgi:hypothetical protein
MKKKIVLLIIVLLIFVGAYFAFLVAPRSLSDQEKEKELAKILGRKPNLNGKPIRQGDVLHQGKYMSFYYPAQSVVYHQLVNGQAVEDKGALEFFEFDMEEPRLLAVTEVIVGSSSIQGVSDYPSVRLRQSQPEIYKQSSLKANSQSGLEFDTKNSTGYERSAFFYVNGRLYSFSIQSANVSKLAEIFNKIMLTLKFL